MDPEVHGEQNGKRHREREHSSGPPLEPTAIVFTLGGWILPEVPSGEGKPDEKGPERLPRGDADRSEHPPDAARKVGDHRPDWQDTREYIQETTAERRC